MLADRTAASAGLPPPRACKQRSWDLHLARGDGRSEVGQFLTPFGCFDLRDDTVVRARRGGPRLRRPARSLPAPPSAHVLVLALDHVDRCLDLIAPRWPDDFPVVALPCRRSSFASGSVTTKVEPPARLRRHGSRFPGVSPRWRAPVDSPRPVPFPTSFVVKNGSNTRSRTADAMPTPLSRTVNVARPLPSPTSASPLRSVHTPTAIRGR